MKRTVSLILACATVVALLSGCGNKTTEPDKAKHNKSREDR